MHMGQSHMPRYLTLVQRIDKITDQHLAFIQSRRDLARDAVPEGADSYFRRHARMRSAHGSVSIEGNPLDLHSVQFAALEESSPDRFRREARNAERAHRLVRELAGDESLEIDAGLLRMLNTTLLDGLPSHGAERAGRFREGGAMIIDTATQQFVYTGPPAAWISDLMGGLIEQINVWRRNDGPEVAAAKAHFGFVSIHPFSDGNGRTARLLADLILAMNQVDVDGMISISSVIRGQRDAYYEALRASQGTAFSERVDVTAFVRFHCGVIADAIRQLEAQASAFQHRWLILRSNFDRVLNDRRVIGLNALMELGRVSSSHYAELTDCAQPTAFSDLNALAEAGLVERVGRGKATRYGLTPSIRSMLDSAS